MKKLKDRIYATEQTAYLGSMYNAKQGRLTTTNLMLEDLDNRLVSLHNERNELAQELLHIEYELLRRTELNEI